MFEVLAFVYENYWGADSCPEFPTLQRKLNGLGFADHEVIAALVWLEELRHASHQVRQGTSLPDAAENTNATAAGTDLWSPSAGAMRCFTDAEQGRLGAQGWGLLTFLIQAGALNPLQLELVLERTLATPASPLDLNDLKLVILMVYWSLGEEPDALVLDELCDNHTDRLAI